MTRSWPLRGIRCPTEASVVRPSLRAARAASRPCGWNSSRSTPLRSTRTRPGATPSSTRLSFSAAQTVMMPAAWSAAHRMSLRGIRYSGMRLRVGAAPGDHDRLVELAPQQGRCDPVRIEVMGVDQVEALGLAGQPPDQAARRRIERERCGGHADLGHEREARMQDLEAQALFLQRHVPGGAQRRVQRAQQRIAGHGSDDPRPRPGRCAADAPGGSARRCRARAGAHSETGSRRSAV